MRILFTIAWIILVLHPGKAQTETWRQKIDAQLWEKARQKGKTDFLIILKEQGDVSAADNLRRKAEKGAFVFKTLQALADRSQTSLKKMLDNHQAPWLSFWVINGMWSEGTPGLIEQIAQLPEVDRLEDNPVVSLQLVPQSAEGVVDRLTPNSWGLTKIQADQVWNMGFTGAGAVVGGQDTGYEWQHPAIKDKYRGWNGSTADHNYNWHDAIHALINGGTNSCGINLTAPCDDNDHGTHTMGTMTGGSDPGNTVGVAPDAKWMGCRNMESGDGTPATYIECFQWFIAPTNISNGSPDPSMAPDVINNSWGCPTSEGCNSGNFATMETVLNSVVAAGIVVVVSAGNSGSGCSTVDTPAAIYSNSFDVGATSNTSNDAIAGFSSRGPVTNYGASHMKPDVSAPGVSIYSCIGNSNNSGTYTYATYSGTSMAGPHVVGTVALILSARPDLKGQVATIENLIKNSTVIRFASAPFCGTDNANSHPNNVYGYGRIDALAAVNAALALPVELTAFTASKSGHTSLLQWSTASEAGCLRFDVMRSSDGTNWQTIGAVNCKGGQPNQYQLTDNNPEKGINYYRLKQVDFSGTFAYSNVQAVAFSPTGISLTPQINATNATVRFQVVGADALQNLYLDVFQADGKLVLHEPFLHQIIDIHDWPAGLYLATLFDENGRALAAGKIIR
jgi:subtilisin family serine protease